MPSKATPRTVSTNFRIRTLLTVGPRDLQAGAEPAAIEAPAILDPSLLPLPVRQLMFSVERAVADADSLIEARRAATRYLERAIGAPTLELNAGTPHWHVAGRWVSVGGYLFQVLDSATGDPFGLPLRAYDDLWLRAAVAVESV